MKFTKTEINLCKKIAERHRKEIKYGDWYYTTEFPEEKDRLRIYPFRWTSVADKTINKKRGITLLWTIEDCLEFLRKQMYAFERAYQLGNIFDVSFISVKGTTKKGSGDTILEACLKAVLVVLE